MSQLLFDQMDFFDYLCLWGVEVKKLGYRAKFLYALRCDNCPKNSPGSLHPTSRAVDIALFKGGQYLTTVDEWREAGALWESLNPKCSWGGRFHGVNAGDANHLSWGEIREIV
jgi:hypothetical protein